MNIVFQMKIVSLDVAIELLKQKDKETVEGYDKQLKDLLEAKAIYEDQLKGYERLLKRERFKRKLITGAGILATGGAILLSLRK